MTENRKSDTFNEAAAPTPEQLGWALLKELRECASADLAKVTELINRGALLDLQDSDGVAPLMYAAGFLPPDIVRVLLDKKVALDTQDSRGNTALIAAVAWGRTDAVRMLIDAGADIERKRKDGRGVFEKADEKNFTHITAILRAAQEDIKRRELDKFIRDNVVLPEDLPIRKPVQIVRRKKP